MRMPIRPGPGVEAAARRFVVEHDLDDEHDGDPDEAFDTDADAAAFWHAHHVPDLVWAMRMALGAMALETGGRWPGEVTLGVSFASDSAVRALNARWRGRDAPTNVLSWPAADLAPGDAPPPHLGDLAFAYGTVAREAEAMGWPFDAYLAWLALHGALHCLGHDHETGEADAEAMERLEARALARLGLPDPYAGTEPA